MEFLKPEGSPRDPADGEPATVFRYDLVWEFVSAIVEGRPAVIDLHFFNQVGNKLDRDHDIHDCHPYSISESTSNSAMSLTMRCSAPATVLVASSKRGIS